jgi:hypothetical protein
VQFFVVFANRFAGEEQARSETRAKRYIFSLKLANKLKTEFKREVQAHNKKQSAILNSTAQRTKPQTLAMQQRTNKKATPANLNLSTNLLLMRYLSFSFSSPRSPHFFDSPLVRSTEKATERRSRAKIAFKVKVASAQRTARHKKREKY